MCLTIPFSFSADDMGLGKTLTMISLMMRHRELVDEGILSDDFSSLKEEENRDGDGSEWISKNSGMKYVA